MKHIKLFSILLLIGAIAVSCKKEEKKVLSPQERLIGGIWSLAKISTKYKGSDEEEVLHDGECTTKSILLFDHLETSAAYASHWTYYEKDGSECKEMFGETDRSSRFENGYLTLIHSSKYFSSDGFFIAKVEFDFEGIFEILRLTQTVSPEETRIFKFARTY